MGAILCPNQVQQSGAGWGLSDPSPPRHPTGGGQRTKTSRPTLFGALVGSSADGKVLAASVPGPLQFASEHPAEPPLDWGSDGGDLCPNQVQQSGAGWACPTPLHPAPNRRRQRTKPPVRPCSERWWVRRIGRERACRSVREPRQFASGHPAEPQLDWGSDGAISAPIKSSNAAPDGRPLSTPQPRTQPAAANRRKPRAHETASPPTAPVARAAYLGRSSRRGGTQAARLPDRAAPPPATRAQPPPPGPRDLANRGPTVLASFGTGVFTCQSCPERFQQRRVSPPAVLGSVGSPASHGRSGHAGRPGPWPPGPIRALCPGHQSRRPPERVGLARAVPPSCPDHAPRSASGPGVRPAQLPQAPPGRAGDRSLQFRALVRRMGAPADAGPAAGSCRPGAQLAGRLRLAARGTPPRLRRDPGGAPGPTPLGLMAPAAARHQFRLGGHRRDARSSRLRFLVATEPGPP